MRIFRSRAFYIGAAAVLLLAILGYFYARRDTPPPAPTQQTNTETNDTPAQKAQDKVVKTITFSYKTIDITKDMLDSGQVPPCCRQYYPAGSKALIIVATSPDGSTNQYWFDVATSGGGRNSFDFVPLSGNDRIIGVPGPRSLGQAKAAWTAMKFKGSEGEVQIKVKDVQIAVDFINDSFSSIPHANEE